MADHGKARIYEVIDFYKNFPQYTYNSQSELFYHLYPSFSYGQYRIYRDKNDIIGFCNWCFLDDLSQARFIKYAHLSPDQWKSGDNFWIHDVVASKNTVRILKDIKRLSLITIGNRKKVNYLRIKNNGIFARRSVLTKNHWGN